MDQKKQGALAPSPLASSKVEPKKMPALPFAKAIFLPKAKATLPKAWGQQMGKAQWPIGAKKPLGRPKPPQHPPPVFPRWSCGGSIPGVQGVSVFLELLFLTMQTLVGAQCLGP